MKMILRETQVLSIDDFINVDVMDFSKLRLVHPVKPNTGRPIDLGAIVYSERQRNKTINSSDGDNPTLVDPTSFRKERLFCISNFAPELIGKEPSGRETLLKEILPIFDWMDMNNHQDFLISTQHFHEAYLSYTNYLIARIKTKNHVSPINTRVGKDKQWMCRKLIRIAFPDEQDLVIAGIITLKGKSDIQTPVLENYLDEYWDLNLEIFHKFAAQCHSNKNFPPCIKTSKIDSYYLPCPGRQLPILTVYTEARTTKNKTKITNFNYQTGEYKYNLTSMERTQIDSLQELMTNPRTLDRIHLAMRAQYAFIQLFRILTRVNNAELIKLEYSDNFIKEREKTSKEFYEVKFRANKRPITLRIDKDGYKIFLEFLTLRAWILNDRTSPYLFFSLGKGNKDKPRQLSRQLNYMYHDFLIRTGFVSPSSGMLQDQQLRNANTRFLRKKGYSAKETADNNNHSVAISEEIYSTPTVEEQVRELDGFWSACESTLDTVMQIRTEKNHPTTSGSCSTDDEIPISIMDEPPIPPDCKTPQSCLFCIYYVCHADEEDLRKLLSLLFVIQIIMDKTVDFEFADQTYGLLAIRIDYILEGISAISKSHYQLVTRLKIEVLEDGVLNAFWNKRLDHYETIGLINI
jgi:hypothetical protein